MTTTTVVKETDNAVHKGDWRSRKRDDDDSSGEEVGERLRRENGGVGGEEGLK